MTIPSASKAKATSSILEDIRSAQVSIDIVRCHFGSSGHEHLSAASSALSDAIRQINVLQ